MKWNPLSLAVLFVLQTVGLSAHAQEVQTIHPGLLPVEKVSLGNSSVEKLFPLKYRSLRPSTTFGDVAPTPVASATPAPTATPTPGASPVATTPSTTVSTKSSLQCNLFENSDLVELSSAVNSLNQAVGTPSCSGSSAVGAQTVLDGNKKIMDSVGALQGFMADPSTITPESSVLIANNVDIAIRTANSMITTLANTDLMNKSCRDQMDAGQVALAVNDIINGLTPYALMAATMTGGTAAVPFIVGGSVITGALSSMNKLVNESAKKLQDAKARRAIVENACQFIRLDQKYKFLIKNRAEQVQKISTELSSTRKLFSNQMTGLSSSFGNLIERKAVLTSDAAALDRVLTPAVQQLEMDKIFLNGTNDPLKICQIGIQWAVLANEKGSYIDSILGSVDTALTSFGSTSVAEARALKFSSQYALQGFNQFASLPFTLNSDFAPCAALSKSFFETMDQTAKFSKRLMKLAVDNANREIKENSLYPQVQTQLEVLNKKQLQSELVVGSLDNLKAYATSFVQSEIAAEMSRLRMQVFGTGTSLVAWFQFTENLHNSAAKDFTLGLRRLQNQAYMLTESGKRFASSGGSAFVGLTLNQKDWDDAQVLKPFDSLVNKKGTFEHTNACREMKDVWDRWVVAVDHLSALESLCGMIDSYVYDTRTEDRAIVKVCRGTVDGLGARSKSNLQNLKDSLVQSKSAEWVLALKAKLTALGCN